MGLSVKEAVVAHAGFGLKLLTRNMRRLRPFPDYIRDVFGRQLARAVSGLQVG